MSESAVYIGVGRPPEKPLVGGFKETIRKAFTFKGAEQAYKEKHAKEFQEITAVNNALTEEERQAAMVKLEKDAQKSAQIKVIGNYRALAVVTATVTFGGFLIGNEKFRRYIGKTKFIGKPLEKFGDTGSDFLHGVVKKLQAKLHPNPLGNPNSPPSVQGEYADFSLDLMQKGLHDFYGINEPYVDRSYNNFERTMPIDTEEMRFGIFNLGKWSEATGGKETSGILYVDANNKTRFRDYMSGDENSVQPNIFDCGRSDVFSFIRDSMNQMKQTFVLLPPNYPSESQDWPLPKENIIERGKQVLGSIHYHPDDSPPSYGDIVQMLTNKVNHIAGVHTKDKTYFMVRSKETPIISAQAAKVLTKELERRMIKNGLTNEAAMNLLTEYAKKYNVVVYAGHLVDGVLSRII